MFRNTTLETCLPVIGRYVETAQPRSSRLLAEVVDGRKNNNTDFHARLSAGSRRATDDARKKSAGGKQLQQLS